MNRQEISLPSNAHKANRLPDDFKPVTSPSQETEDSIEDVVALYRNVNYANQPEAVAKEGLLRWKHGQLRKGKEILMAASKDGNLLAMRSLADILWGESASSSIGKSSEDVTSSSSDSSEEGSPGTSSKIIQRRQQKSRKKAFRLWVEAAERFEDVYSMRKIAECYAAGDAGLAVDMRQAMAYWEQAAVRHDKPAIHALIRCHPVALALLTRSMESLGEESSEDQTVPGIAESTEEMADEEYTEQTIWNIIKVAAEDGDSLALRQMAEANLKGTRLVPRSVDDAIDFYKKAAKQGDVTSLLTAAALLYEGTEGLPPNRHEAFQCLIDASREGGDVSTLKALADAYRTGVGAPNEIIDLAQSMSLYQEAAAHGCAESTKALADLYYTGWGPENPSDKQKAAELYESAFDAGVADAGMPLAKCYWLGYGGKIDRAKAISIWKSAVCKSGSCSEEEAALMQNMKEEDFQVIIDNSEI
ncbi:hypothetical protein DFS34DRAFT_455334 [Phlyctochytrium arcticum]|nr:hypothetical protein DFS34DRAFT_455334 [Phlyctochytrium arcticum]